MSSSSSDIEAFSRITALAGRQRESLSAITKRCAARVGQICKRPRLEAPLSPIAGPPSSLLPAKTAACVKQCSTCGVVKSETHFGAKSQCRVCVNRKQFIHRHIRAGKSVDSLFPSIDQSDSAEGRFRDYAEAYTKREAMRKVIRIRCAARRIRSDLVA